MRQLRAEVEVAGAHGARARVRPRERRAARLHGELWVTRCRDWRTLGINLRRGRGVGADTRMRLRGGDGTREPGGVLEATGVVTPELGRFPDELIGSRCGKEAQRIQRRGRRS